MVAWERDCLDKMATVEVAQMKVKEGKMVNWVDTAGSMLQHGNLSVTDRE
jgi:hypothetical protein